MKLICYHTNLNEMKLNLGWNKSHTCLCSDEMSRLNIGLILVRASTGEKWHKRHLTYHIMNGPRNLSPSQVHVAVKMAFQLWSNVSVLIFQELQHGPADIRLAFEGEHNDGTGNAFDGPGDSFFLSL